jgi:DNA integrity scanning protein DisA with diadenylate cyclase activity
MGLSEKSDALAIVVSEERGTISLFSNGRLRQLDDPEKIAAAITPKPYPENRFF